MLRREAGLIGGGSVGHQMIIALWRNHALSAVGLGLDGGQERAWRRSEPLSGE